MIHLRLILQNLFVNITAKDCLEKKGVVGKLLRSLPHLIFTHCICHQIILGVKDLFKKKDTVYVNSVASELKILNDLVYKLSSYFTTSSKRSLVLIEAEDELDEDFNFHKLIRPLDIRWLSHFPAIQRILDLYPAIIKALANLSQLEKDKFASTMNNELKELWNVAMLHTYADILSPLNSLTKQFQDADINFEAVQTSYRCCISALKAFSQKKLGIRATGFFASLRQDNNLYYFENIALDTSGPLEDQKERLRAKTKEIADIFIKSLEKWFCNFERLIQFGCLDIDRIKSLKSNEFETFGEKDIKALCSFYINTGFLKKKNRMTDPDDMYILDQTEVLEEYSIFKRLTLNEYKKDSRKEIYRKVLRSTCFKNISRLISISLVVPLNSVECERNFSRMKVIKTRLRNSLEENTLDDLMLISLSNRDLDQMNFVKPIENWKAAKKRYFY